MKKNQSIYPAQSFGRVDWLAAALRVRQPVVCLNSGGRFLDMQIGLNSQRVALKRAMRASDKA